MSVKTLMGAPFPLTHTDRAYIIATQSEKRLPLFIGLFLMDALQRQGKKREGKRKKESCFQFPTSFALRIGLVSIVMTLIVACLLGRVFSTFLAVPPYIPFFMYHLPTEVSHDIHFEPLPDRCILL
jgi:hypothetical protein